MAFGDVRTRRTLIRVRSVLRQRPGAYGRHRALCACPAHISLVVPPDTCTRAASREPYGVGSWRGDDGVFERGSHTTLTTMARSGLCTSPHVVFPHGPGQDSSGGPDGIRYVRACMPTMVHVAVFCVHRTAELSRTCCSYHQLL